ncbi:MAG: universal stress protein [Acidobacteria bacterium]|nr:universal stress protein [Acidobacteriota bacterium]
MFRTTGPIFTAVRLDESATEVLRQAVDIARHYKVKLYVCHVLPDLMAVRPLFPHLQFDDAMQSAEFESEARRRLAARVGAFINPEGSDCEILIERGTEYAAIAEAAKRTGCGMIVVGHGSRHERLSRIAERVVRYAHCPVLVARPSRKGCVLAATDFSDPATPAVEAASSEAKRRGLDLHIIHAFDIIKFSLAPDADAMPKLLPIDICNEMQESLQKRLDACVREVSAKSGIIVREAADTAILDAAEDLPADLIVLATHGRTGLSRLALGSVAETVVRGARCSVLVVRLKAG